MAQLSDRELVMKLERLVRCEWGATAALVAHLVEMERRDLYLAVACSSLFTYCTQVLHLSEQAAYRRIAAARVARKYPMLVDLLARGSVNLTAVTLLAPHLTPENHEQLFAAVRHRSRRRVEELIARLQPQPPVPTSVRKLPIPRSASTGPAPPPAETPAEPGDAGTTRPSQPAAVDARPPLPPAPPPPVTLPSAVPLPATRRAVVAPLAPEHYKVQFTATAATYGKLRRAQDLLRHQIPNGDPAAVLDRALTVLLQHLERTKLAATDRPRPGRETAPRSRHVPAGVKRAVWQRDGGRCAFVSQDGRRCSESGFLEFHHVAPHGDGGEATIENIELRCRAHNRYEADQYYGR